MLPEDRQSHRQGLGRLPAARTTGYLELKCRVSLKFPAHWRITIFGYSHLLRAWEGPEGTGRGEEGPLTHPTGQGRGDPPCADFLVSTLPHTTFSRSGPSSRSVRVGRCPLTSQPTLWDDIHRRLPTSILTLTSPLLGKVSELAEREPGTAEPDLR